MKIVVTSDWHLDASTAGVSRFDDVRTAAMQVMQHAIASKADLFLFLGDLCDPDAARAPRCVAVAIEIASTLASHGIMSRWLVGNHDVIEDGSGTSTLTPLAAYGHARSDNMVRVAYDLSSERIDGVRFIWLPFPARGLSYDPIGEIESMEPDDGAVVVAGHLTVPGVDPGSETHEMPRGRDVNFPLEAVREHFPNALLMNGHYHVMIVGDVHIPGSLERLTFGEEQNNPGWLEARIEKPKRGAPKFAVEKWRNLHARPLRTINWTGAESPLEDKDALVRILPVANADPARLAAYVDALSVQAVKVLPSPTSADVVTPLQVAAVPRQRARDVVEAMVAEAIGVERANLADFVREIMDAEGL